MIDQLFDRMDTWRHLPNYQLERRADLFFSLYLQQVILSKTSIEICDTMVPEFPVRIGTIYPDKPIDKSYKIDYVVVSKKGDLAYLVELKTDGASRRDSQDAYLDAAKNVGMEQLLKGILQIFQATQAKRKYFHLLVQLEKMGLLQIPAKLKDIMGRKSLLGANQASEDIRIVSQVSQCEILYIQPNGESKNEISFVEIADIIENNSDPIADRFSRSLRNWAAVTAGQGTVM